MTAASPYTAAVLLLSPTVCVQFDEASGNFPNRGSNTARLDHFTPTKASGSDGTYRQAMSDRGNGYKMSSTTWLQAQVAAGTMGGLDATSAVHTSWTFLLRCQFPTGAFSANNLLWGTNQNAAGAERGLLQYINSSSKMVADRAGTSNTWTSSQSLVADGTAHLYAYVKNVDANTSAAYLDGVAITGASGAQSNEDDMYTKRAFTIGANFSGNDTTPANLMVANTIVGDFALVPSALTTTQILALISNSPVAVDGTSPEFIASEMKARSIEQAQQLWDRGAGRIL